MSCWAAAAACGLVSGLSVSRGALLASAAATAVGFRGILRRGTQPVILLVLFAAVLVNLGLVGQIATLYEERGLEETGRLLLWPHVVDRILTSPVVGVGAGNIATYIPEISTYISTPHNSFLFFGLAAGVVPLALWTLFWLRTTLSAISCAEHSRYRTLQLPFLVYVLITYMTGDINMDPWVLLSIAVAAHSTGQPAAAVRFIGKPVGHPRWALSQEPEAASNITGRRGLPATVAVDRAPNFHER